MSANTQQYEERKKRLHDVLSLRKPDRVPISPKMGTYYCREYGVSVYEAMKDIRNVEPAVIQFVNEFQPDYVRLPVLYPIDPLEQLESTFIKWPGPTHRLPLSSSFQILDGTYLEDDEFGEFLLDPTHFILTRLLPRKKQGSQGVRKTVLPQSRRTVVSDRPGHPGPTGRQGVAARRHPRGGALGALAPGTGPDRPDRDRDGFPAGTDHVPELPVRHVRRQHPGPDDHDHGYHRTAGRIRGGAGGDDADLHRADHPGGQGPPGRVHPDPAAWRRRRVHGAGTVRTILLEGAAGHDDGDHTGRDDSIRLLRREVQHPARDHQRCAERQGGVPLRKCGHGQSEKTVGRVACLCGNLPTATLVAGTRQQTIDECKWLIDHCADGGGFIMDCSIVLDNAKRENLEAMFETTLTYGRY